MKLMIVESPNKAKKIKTLLPDGWLVQGSGGHIRDLPDREMGVSAPNFHPQYVVTANSRNTVKRLKDLVAKATYVVLATDLDREGEAIAWHLKEVLKLKDPDRITFNEVTKKAILEAIAAPRKLDMKLVGAQEARRVIDRVVGYTVSPAITRRNPTGETLSAGRVQSVALRIVVDRELEIRHFKPTAFYELLVHFKHDGIKWSAKWDHRHYCSQVGLDDSHFLDGKVIEQFRQSIELSPHFKVHDIVRKQSERKAPAAFTTSTLQQAASASLSIAPEQCMRLAQSLFEHGLISYHRTDSPNLSDDAIADARKYIQKYEADKGIKGLLPSTPNKWKSKESAQEAHEAIRPTDIFNEAPAEITDEERQLYTLIHQRTVACQMANAVYDKIAVALLSSAKLNKKSQPFVARASIRTFPGWMVFTPDDSAEEKDEDAEAPQEKLPELRQGMILQSYSAETQEKETKAPPRYTEAGLVKKMEAEGVGRPATYASTLKTIKSKSYVKVQKKVLVPQAIGERVRNMLVEAGFKFVEISYTRQLEEFLDAIAHGQIRYAALVKQVYNSVHADITLFNSLDQFAVPDHPCPQCRAGNLLRRQSQHKQGQFYWRCDNYQGGCKGTYPDRKVKDGDNPEPDLDAAPKDKAKDSGITCPKCGTNTLVLRRANNSIFWGCSGFPKCKTSVKGDESRPDPTDLERFYSANTDSATS